MFSKRVTRGVIRSRVVSRVKPVYTPGYTVCMILYIVLYRQGESVLEIALYDVEIRTDRTRAQFL